jgi:hypothetical protein
MAKNRLLRILLLPMLAVVFLIGYALATIGEPKPRKTHKHMQNKPTQNTSPEIEIGVLVPQEEQPLITHQNKQKA